MALPRRAPAGAPRPAPPAPAAAGAPSSAVSLARSVVQPTVKVAPPAPSAPGSPVERARVLISVMDRLSDLIGRELVLVRNGAADAVTTLQADKRALTARLDEIGRLLRLDRTSLTALPPDLLGVLKESGDRLRGLTAASAELLDIQAEAQKNVVDVVVKSVNQERRADAAYGQLRRGFVPKAPRLTAGRSVTYNTTL